MAGPACLRRGYADRRVRQEVEPPFNHRRGVCRSVGRPVKPAYGTILEIGSSRMSVAPFDFSKGMSVLTVAFSTTVSMA